MSHLILFGAILAPMVVLLGIVLGWRFLFDRDRRRSPLNFKVLNLPGDGLRKQIARHDEVMNEAGTTAMLAGPLMLAAWAVSKMIAKDGSLSLAWDGSDWLFVVMALALIAWSARRFIRHGRLKRSYAQGLAAEIATAQNLMPLMMDGCMVFHDFPGDGFNIDHVVVAPHAVFAVETKSRKKPATGGRDAAKVTYDGRKLQFPGHVDTASVEQAQRQAQWLAKFLVGSAGDPVHVVPVLALPGWYVEWSKEGSRAEVIVNNCRNPVFLLKIGPRNAMDASLFRRVGHALTERYPEIG